MSSINETQRKYLMKRVETIRQSKIGQLNTEYRSSINPLDRFDRATYMRQELERVGLSWEVNNYGNIVLPPEQEARETSRLQEVERGAKLKEFNVQANALLDKIILGNDSEELGAALEALSNFN